MTKTILSMQNQTDINTLYGLLKKMKVSNKVFTIHFYEHSGEPRIINGVAKNFKHVKGTGDRKLNSSSKLRDHNIFQCWEVQITKAEKKLTEYLNVRPKQPGYKNIQIENITYIKFEGQEWKVKGNRFRLDPRSIELYRKEVYINTLSLGKQLKASDEVIDSSLILSR